MRKLRIAFAVLATCSAAWSAHAAPASPWKEEESTDTMTDAKRYMISTFDKPHEGSFSIECDPDGENALFLSALFLADAEKGTIKVRYDDEKARDENAFLSKKTVLFRDPKIPPSFTTDPADKYVLELAAHAFLVSLKSHPHKRMRVRLVSFDGEAADLDFDITGLQAMLTSIESKCGINAPHAP